MTRPLSKFCNLICGDTADILVCYEISLDYSHISPTCRKDYNFIIRRFQGKISLLYGAHSLREFIAFAYDYTPKGILVTDFLKQISPTHEFFSDYKERFYLEKDLSSQEESLIAKVEELDYTTPHTVSCGYDGFSLHCWTPECGKEFRIWCCHHDEYYKPITDLANALLDIANVDPEYRFIFYKQ